MFSLLLPPVHLSPIILTRGSWLQVSPSPVWLACVHSWVMLEAQFSTVPTTNPGKKEKLMGTREPLQMKRSPLLPVLCSPVSRVIANDANDLCLCFLKTSEASIISWTCLGDLEYGRKILMLILTEWRGSVKPCWVQLHCSDTRSEG